MLGFIHLDIKICYETKIFLLMFLGPFTALVKEQSDFSE